MANTYLTRTHGSSPTNLKKWTFSAWIKKTKITGANQKMFSTAYVSAGEAYIFFDSSDRLSFGQYTGGGASNNFYKTTNRRFRDLNGWYHIQVTWDTTQSTAADRIRIYVNGAEETSLFASANATLNADGVMNTNRVHYLSSNAGSNHFFEGLMSHVHFTDGYAYAPTTFGEVDATTGIWKIKTNPSVTYGNNGFFLFKDNAAVTDQSGNSNDYTLGGGTLVNTQDCPSNVFATLDSLNVPTSSAPTFSFGNTKTITMNVDPGYFGGTSTLGASSGKYYSEIKITDNNGVANVGITFDPSEKARQGATFSAQISNSFVYANTGKQYSTATGTSGASYGNTYTDGDIIGIAMDLDNSKLYFHKNGTYENSGVPTSGSTGTGAISITAGETYFFYLTDVGGNTATYECNFGDGFFGTSAVSSAGNNASGNGIFEYDVPSGYTALSTKGLNL